MESSKVLIHCEKLNKKYGNKIVIEDMTFDVYKGEFLSLLGSSGCGKTTLLRMLVGIEDPDSGSITKAGCELIGLRPKERNIGIVFQNYSLFPNMSVYKNIAYALRTKVKDKTEVDKRVKDIIGLVGLEEHVYKRPRQLSGGQQQRVAIARTLVMQPDVILFDEPMSALDADIKIRLRKLIKDIQKTLGITMIYVTHDQEEAFALSDRIMVINDSRIAQLDKPREIFHHPANGYVESFVVDHLNEKIESIEASIK